MSAKQLLIYWDGGGMNVLVPKKRGEGFLRVPFGHHHDQALTDIRDKASTIARKIAPPGGCELDGLDGFLCFDLGGAITVYPDRRKQFQEAVAPLLERHYGMPSCEVSKGEFFGILGVNPTPLTP